KNDEDGESSLADFVEDSGESPEDATVTMAMEADVRGLLSALSEKERDIIEKRYGFNGEEPKSLKAIGDEYNLTKERIRQIEKIALLKIKEQGEVLGIQYYNQAV
ncbi:MAG: hypothetical protein MJZ16_13570, partial [Bacteroidales bacterium]|nr:hypothetical protein [Bacteroidales bacterium]